MTGRASCTCRTGFFGSKAGSFTSFFSRTGHSPSGSPMGEASIHGGGAGAFRQVCAASCYLAGRCEPEEVALHRCNAITPFFGTPESSACLHAQDGYGSASAVYAQSLAGSHTGV